MRLFLCVALFFIAAPAIAQDNTLTPKEIADGWLLLFDGETDYGWHGNGSIKTSAGKLEIKNEKTDAVSFKFPLHECEIHCEYLVEGQRATAYLSQVDPKTADLSYVLDGPDNPKQNAWKVFHKELSPSTYGWIIPPATSLYLKNLKVKPTNLKKLYNNKDLTGWKEFPGKKSKFSVNAKGEINIKDGPGDLQTEAKYEDFILQLECISNGKNLNSGVFFRCRPNEYQNGYEVQIRNQFTKEPTQDYVLEEYDPQTHKLLAKKKAKFTAVDYGTGAIYRRQPARKEVSKDGEWFTLTILAHKNHFMTWVNGIQVADFVDNRPPNDNARNGYRQEAGHISLQGHDPTTDLSFRNIRIAEIK